MNKKILFSLLVVSSPVVFCSYNDDDIVRYVNTSIYQEPLLPNEESLSSNEEGLSPKNNILNQSRFVNDDDGIYTPVVANNIQRFVPTNQTMGRVETKQSSGLAMMLGLNNNNQEKFRYESPSQEDFNKHAMRNGTYGISLNSAPVAQSVASQGPVNSLQGNPQLKRKHQQIIPVGLNNNEALSGQSNQSFDDCHKDLLLNKQYLEDLGNHDEDTAFAGNKLVNWSMVHSKGQVKTPVTPSVEYLEQQSNTPALVTDSEENVLRASIVMFTNNTSFAASPHGAGYLTGQGSPTIQFFNSKERGNASFRVQSSEHSAERASGTPFFRNQFQNDDE